MADPLPPVGSLKVITDEYPLLVLFKTALNSSYNFVMWMKALLNKRVKAVVFGVLAICSSKFFEQFGVFDDKMWLIFETFKVIRVL